MTWPFKTPWRIERTGDDTPASSLYRYVWRMSGHHQVWISILAVSVAALSVAPLELQRRIVNTAVERGDADLLFALGGVYLAVVLVQSALKYVMRLYQGWISESAILYCQAHLSSLHARHRSGEGGEGAPGRDDTQGGNGRAVSVIGPEIETVGGFVGEAVSEPLVHGGMLVAILGYMLVVEPVLAAASLLVFIPQLVVVPVLQAMVNRLTARRIDLLRDLGAHVAGEGEVAADTSKDVPTRLLEGLYGNRIRIYALKFASKAAVNVLNALAPLCALVYGGYLVIQGETSLGVVVAFVSGFDRLANPARQLIAFYRVYSVTRVKHVKIANWM